MQEYIWRRQETIVEYIATHPIFDLCTRAERIPGFSQILTWWDQEHSQEEGGNGYNQG